MGGGRCEALVRATGPGPEGEARRGHPSNDSESGGAPGFLSRLLPQTGRETTFDPEPGHALKGLAAGTAPPDWGCWVRLRLLSTNLDL